MGGSSSPPPPVADPYATSAAQFQSNLAAGESAQAASNVNQITPTGSLMYYQTGIGPNGVPTYTAVQQLTPAQQELLTLQEQGKGLAGGAASNLLRGTFDQYSTPYDIGGPTSGTTKALLDQQVSYLSPYFQQQTDQLDNQLRNQGIMPGTPAYNQQMDAVRQQQNRSVTSFLAQAEPLAFNQAVQQYQLPLSTATQLFGLNQPMGVNPTATPGANYQPANVTGAVSSAQDAQMKAYQAQQQQDAAMMSGMFNTGAAAITAAGVIL